MSDDNKNLPPEEPTVQIGDITVEQWLYDLYSQEADKLLDAMRSGLSNIDRGINKDIVRAFHTLGSSSRTLGVPDVAQLGYAMEALLDSLVEQASASSDFIIPETVVGLIREGCAAMETQVGRIRDKQNIEDFSELVDRLEKVTSNWANSMSTVDEAGSAEINFETSTNVVSDGWFDSSSSADPFGSSSGGDDWLSSMENLAAETEKVVKENLSTTPVEFLQVPVIEIKNEAPPDAIKKQPVDIPRKPAVVTTAIITSTKMVDATNRLSFTDLPESISFLTVSDAFEDDIDPEIMTLFSDEAIELLPQMSGLIEAWKQDNGEQNSDSCRLLKRVLHTLKGSSRMAGCMRFGSFVHNLEGLVEGAQKDIPADRVPYLVAIAGEIILHEMDVLQKTSSVTAPVISSHPTTGMAETNIKQSRVKQAQQAQVSQMLRVPIERMDKMSTSLAHAGMMHQRILANLGRFDGSLTDMGENVARLHKLIKEVDIQAEVQMQSRIKIAGDNFDPLEFDRFTRLQELTRMISEAMHDISMVQQNLERSLVSVSDAVEEQNLVNDDLRYEVITSRMLPIHSLSMRLDKIVRQACRDTAKSAQLDIVGAEEIDSGVLNKVITPLEHLLRNAVAHGIESKDKRALEGKNETGSIVLTVKQAGNEIRFEIKDDGAGIDPARVTKKAIEAGLIEEGEQLSQEKANDMIFASGFSTADSVSQLAGKGVGLDVVRGEVANMGGWAAVDSKLGKGSTFIITVPSYMALMSTVPVIVGDDLYGIPSSLVRDIRVIPNDQMEFGYITGMLSVGDTEHQLHSFNRLIHGGKNPDITRNNTVMILEENGQTLALHVEGIQSDANLVIRPMCKTVAAVPGTVGASISGEGLPFIILNPIRMRKPDLAEPDMDAILTERQLDATRRRSVNEILVMVVDDSLTVRKISEMFLTRVGFKVCTARDGMDALEKLQEYKPDIFLLDIEMPRMDGFELATTLRNSEATKTTPIVMISSRAIEKHQSHAFALGVNAYLGKPYKEDELLAEIQKWTNHEPIQGQQIDKK